MKVDLVEADVHEVLDQRGVLDLTRRRLAPDATLDGFIHAIVTDAEYRLRLTEFLAKAA